MGTSNKQNSDLLAKGGGNATSGGVSMQASVAASIAVQALIGDSTDGRLGLGAAKPISVLAESEIPVDDIAIETDAKGWVFIQSKNSLSGGTTTLTSEFGKTCDEIARLWMLTSSGDGKHGWNRPLQYGQDAIVIAIGPTSSGTFKTHLHQALNAVRARSIQTLNGEAEKARKAFETLLGKAFAAHGLTSGLDVNEVMKFVHVLTFDFAGTDRSLAETRIATHLDEPDKARAAFKVIEKLCQDTMTARSRCDVDDIRTELAANGLPVKSATPSVSEKLSGIQSSVDALTAATRPVSENTYITDEALRQLKHLRQSRFFTPAPDLKLACLALCKSVENGDLISASSKAKQSIFAWCGRILTAVDIEEAKRLTAMAERFGTSDETRIARAFLLGHTSETERATALAALAPLRTSESYAAALIIASLHVKPADALQWLGATGLDIDEFHPDGKFRILGMQMQAGDWSAALSTVNALTDEDYAETPGLLLQAANTFLGQAAHPDFRKQLDLPLPQDPKDYPLRDDPVSREFRGKAILLYKRTASELTKLNAGEASAIASDRALWLELRDPLSHAAALTELQDSMNDEQVRLRRVPLAVAFNLKLNSQAIEADIERAFALSGGHSADAAMARLAISLRKKPAEVIIDFERYRGQLTAYYTPIYINALEIEALAKAGRASEARAKLATIRSTLEPPIATRLESIIDETEGADPVASREQDYNTNPAISTLLLFVDELRRARDFQRLAEYGEKLFSELNDVSSAETYVSALFEIKADGEIVEFSKNNPDIANASAVIRTSLVWAHYRLGNFCEAKALLDSFPTSRNDRNDRELGMMIAIASGDWSALGTFVESEWSNREDRQPDELLRAGVLAQRIGIAARSQELVREAARRANDDPSILVKAYNIASSSGWEDNEDIHVWLRTAIEKSGEDGPIQRFDLKDIMNEQPRWDQQMDNLWNLLLRGEVPIFAAAQASRRTLLDLTLRPALANRSETDPRKRSLIFSFSGGRSAFAVPGKSIGLDITAIISLAIVGHIGRVLDWCESAHIAHTTLSWLFEERSKLAFHQPTQVQKAKEVKKLLDTGKLHRFEGGAGSPAVEHEAGKDVASYILAAQTLDNEAQIQKIVIRSYPLPKPGSLLEELADLSGLEHHFAGCVDLLDALRAAGGVTEIEYTNALSYLQLQEKPWPHTPKVQAGATLYLDDLTVSYLQYTGLLARLAPAGFKPFITSAEAQRADELTNFDMLGSEARDMVESIQLALRDGIQSGKVKVGYLVQGDREDQDELHPCHLMTADTPTVDAIIVDDRFINKHERINHAPTATTIELLTTMAKDGALSHLQLTDAKTRLRQAGTIFVPHNPGEILELLNAAPVSQGHVQETAEVRAVRESITRIRMTDALQLPAEAPWMDDLLRELLSVIKGQWDTHIPDEQARARANWALKLLDTRGWAHRSPTTAIGSADRYRALVMGLMVSPSTSTSVRDRYWKWLEDSVLKEFKEEQPQSYNEMLATVRSVINSEVEKGLPLDGLGSRDE